jgi:hypothetical protein
MYFTFHKLYEAFETATLPDGWEFKDSGLYFEGVCHYYISRCTTDTTTVDVYKYKEGWFYENTRPRVAYDYHILSLLWPEEIPEGLYRGFIHPKLWDEFLSATEGKSGQYKRSWMYKKTGVKGTLAKDYNTGEILPKNMLKTIWLDGVPEFFGDTSFLLDREKYFWDNGRYYTLGDHYYEVAGVKIPFSFLITYYNYCDEHGIYYGIECQDCKKKYQIWEYNTRAESILPFKDNGETTPVYMGIELEYEDCKDQVKNVVDALNGHAIVKRDGTIDYGFEICTAPATLAVHKKAFQGFFDKVKLFVKKNCGMHVHVDRRKMGEMQLGKLLAFLYKKENIPWIEAIAGRAYSKNRYCLAENERKITDNFHSRHEFYAKRVRGSAGKYEALNTSPADTIEFRIFSPPKDAKTLYMRLEFVQALFDWTLPGVCGVREAADIDSFKGFVKKYRKVYPEFYEVVKCA